MARHNGRLIEDLETARKRIILGLLAALVIFILFEALRGHHFWNKLKGEGNLWNYGSSVVYFIAGEMAIANAILIGYYQRHSLIGRSWRWVSWAAAGAAFTFLACDEMLTVHERLGLALERLVPWLHRNFPNRVDGLIVTGYAIGAILFAIAFFRGSAVSRKAKSYFVWGFVMVALSSALDVLPKQLYITHLPFRETEELLEVFAGWAFAAAFVSTASVVLAKILCDSDAKDSAVIGIEEARDSALI